jgi:hypothetical protein
MKRKLDLVSLGRYLTYEESERIKGQLNTLKIKYISSGHGLHTGEPIGADSSEFFEIKVNSTDSKRAKEIFNREKVKSSITRLKCPKCGHFGYTEVTNKSIFQKIYYLGTTLVECKKCKEKFTI